MPVPSGARAFREPHSRGPCRGFYTLRPRPGTRRAETPGPPAADARLSAERLRPAVSSCCSAPALLRPTVPASGAAMVAVEGAAELPGDGGGQRKTQWAESEEHTSEL